MSGQPQNLPTFSDQAPTVPTPIISQPIAAEQPEQAAEVAKIKAHIAALQAIIDSNDGKYPAAVIEHLESTIAYLMQELDDDADPDKLANEDEFEIYDEDDNAAVWEMDDTPVHIQTAAQAPSNAPAATAVSTIKYAPNLVPVQGKFSVCGIAVEWKDNPGIAVSKVKSATNALASNYKYLSGGQLVFNPTVRHFVTNYTHTGGHINAVSSAAKNAVGKFDRYVVVTTNLGTSHSGGNTSILRGALKRDWWHEEGHVLPNAGKQRVLGHAGKYVTNSKGKRELDAYGDGSSFMGRFSTDKINPPQMYYCGWAGENKTAQYDFGDGVKEFNMEPSFTGKKTSNVTGVYIPRTDGRPLFVGIIPVQRQLLFSVWDMTGGGTQREVVFNKSASLAGLTFERVQANGSYSTLRISPMDPAAANPTNAAHTNAQGSRPKPKLRAS